MESEDSRKLFEHVYFKDNCYNTTYEAYLEAIEAMSIHLDRLNKNNRSPSVQSEAHASNMTNGFNFGPRLPYLNLPTFDDTPSEWLPFKDLFDSMVLSNNNLSPVWKLHYLKQSLKGTASHFFKNTTLTTENFQKAWDSLVSFYENKRLLVNSAIYSLFSIKRMTKESAAEMGSLYTLITQIYRSLETLGRPVNQWDDFFFFCIYSRAEIRC